MIHNPVQIPSKASLILPGNSTLQIEEKLSGQNLSPTAGAQAEASTDQASTPARDISIGSPAAGSTAGTHSLETDGLGSVKASSGGSEFGFAIIEGPTVDPLQADVLRFFKKTKSIPRVSLIQRAFRLGPNRSLRIMQDLVQAGLVRERPTTRGAVYSVVKSISQAS